MKKLAIFTFLLKIIGFIIASWFLVHILSIFGVFLALAYPLWYLFGFKRIPCLWCQIKKAQFCTFSHSIFDSGLILVFTLFSLGLVFAEAKIIFKMGFPPTAKTVSFVIPTKGQYRLGEIFPMKIEISGVKTPINAVQADLGFDSKKIQIVDISTNESFANIFIQKEINNEVGYARLTGGLPNPGFFSEHGVFGSVFFKGITPGIVQIKFLPSSMVLANDGRGSNVLKDLASASYLILPEKLSQEEEEIQKSIILKPNVLGESNENTKMKFYEEKGVLGTQVVKDIEKVKKFDLGKKILEILEKIDRFILSLWARLTGLTSSFFTSRFYRA